MPAPIAIYTLENCRPAYQLNWSLTVFWHETQTSAEWLPALQTATEPDGVRVLEHRLAEERVSQFLVSTKPTVSPHAMVRSVKGRLQHLLRGERPKAFQRNYCLRSVGSAAREAVEEYVRGQPQHHPMADPRAQAIFERNQICNLHVDLSQPRHGDHAIYWYNLHVVMVHAERICDVNEERIAARRTMILGICQKHDYLLSRGGIVADHIHLALGGAPEQSPGAMVMRFMNNLAYVEGMKRVFAFGYYVGTFGEYDLGAIPRP